MVGQAFRTLEIPGFPEKRGKTVFLAQPQQVQHSLPARPGSPGLRAPSWTPFPGQPPATAPGKAGGAVWPGGVSSPLAPLTVFSLGITWDCYPDVLATEYYFIPPCLEPLENLLSSGLEIAGSSAGSQAGRGEGSFRVA